MPELPIPGGFRHSFYMKSDQVDLIECIQASGFKAAVVLAGGAVDAVHALLSHSGASRFIQEVQIPYSPEAMFDYLGEPLEQACSAKAATIMAQRAFERALIFSLSNKESIPIVGIACTAALQTNRERKGIDRAFISFKTRAREVIHPFVVSPGTRIEQDAELSRFFLEKLSEFLMESDS
jgi:hypothetical protein